MRASCTECLREDDRSFMQEVGGGFRCDSTSRCQMRVGNTLTATFVGGPQDGRLVNFSDPGCSGRFRDSGGHPLPLSQGSRIFAYEIQASPDNTWVYAFKEVA